MNNGRLMETDKHTATVSTFSFLPL